MSELVCPAPKWTEARHAKLVNGYMTPAPREVATGLRFPEGPVAMPDGSVILVEIESQHLTRVKPGGAIERIAHLGGGPNGAAIGPDGRAYICNNGGFDFDRG